MVVVEGIGGHPALRAELTAIPRFVEPANPHRICLKQLFDDVSLGVVEVAVEISLGKGGEVAHPVDEELCVSDAEFLVEFSQKPCRWFRASSFRKSCVQHDFRVNIDCDVQPDTLFFSKLNLLFINRNAVWLGGELLFARLGVGVKPVMDGLSGSADAEPLQQIADFSQRCRDSVESARQPD